MNKELHLDDNQYRWLLSIFYCGYLTFQFGVIGYLIFPASRYMAICIIAWGSVATLQGAAQNWASMMVLRFFLGISEALCLTGVALYLSFFYPRKELGLRHAWFVCGSSISSAIAGSVAYGIQQARTSIASWRLIFIVEAIPTILVGIAIFLWLPDSIAAARFLTAREKSIAEARLCRAKIDVDRRVVATSQDSSNIVLSFVKSRLDVSNLASAFKDPFSYISAVLLFILNVGYSSIPSYLPVILQGMGYTSIRAQAFSAPPYVGAFIVAISVVALSDKLDLRGIFILFSSLLGSIGYLILALVDSNHIRYFAVWLLVISLFVFIPLLYSWLLSNSLGESRKGLSLTILGTFAQSASFLGVRLYPNKEAPYYRKAQWTNFGLLLVAAVLTSFTVMHFRRINRAKDMEMKHLQEADNGKGGSLRYQLTLNPSSEDHRQKIHRRNLDIAENREHSIYFRYSL